MARRTFDAPRTQPNLPPATPHGNPILARYNAASASTQYVSLSILKQISVFMSCEASSNTVVQRRDISSTVLKIMPALSRPLQHGVKHIAQLYHDFFSTSSTLLISSPTLLFALSHSGIFTNFYLLHVLCFLWFFKWGGTFGLPRCSAQPARFRFAFTSYFYFSPSRFIFWRFTILLISLRCHLLKRHDIYDFTTMPSFEAPQYL